MYFLALSLVIIIIIIIKCSPPPQIVSIPGVKEKAGPEKCLQIWYYVIKRFKESSLVHISNWYIVHLSLAKSRIGFHLLVFKIMTLNVNLHAEPVL